MQAGNGAHGAWPSDFPVQEHGEPRNAAAEALDVHAGSVNWKVKDLGQSYRDGVLFNTYATLVSGMKAQRGKRKESQTAWLMISGGNRWPA